MSRKKKQPSTPADIVARRVEKRELKAKGLEVNTDPRTEEITGIWRPDCFTMLLKDMNTERDAIDWLETLIRTASGENGQERRPDYIRAPGFSAGASPSDEMMAAQDRLVVLQESMAPADIRMLFELLKPDEALITRWRPVVQRCTGEVNPQAQGARVRAAATSLAFVRGILERLVRERRDRRRLAA